MIRIAKESDLSAVAAVYEAILDHEDATGLHYTGWKRGAYPTADTARNIFNAGTLYVGVDEDGAIWGSMNLNGVQLVDIPIRLLLAAEGDRVNGIQLPEYKNGGWSIPAEDDQVAVIHTLTIHPDRAGQGLARQMVAFAEDTARRQGKTVMRFDTGVSNAVSNHLYPTIGYRFAGTVDTFFMGYVHCPLNLYEKKL